MPLLSGLATRSELDEAAESVSWPGILHQDALSRGDPSYYRVSAGDPTATLG
jgi:hypothetical protein